MGPQIPCHPISLSEEIVEFFSAFCHTCVFLLLILFFHNHRHVIIGGILPHGFREGNAFAQRFMPNLIIGTINFTKSQTSGAVVSRIPSSITRRGVCIDNSLTIETINFTKSQTTEAVVSLAPSSITEEGSMN